MKYHLLNGVTQRVSGICLGALSVGMIDKKDSDALLDMFVEAGGNFIDTAKIYSDWCCDVPSVSEKALGRWLTERGNRDKMVIGTKGAHHDMKTGQRRLKRTDILYDLDASLTHLQTDYIDVYWLHRDDPDMPVEDIMQTLDECRQSGRILSYGCSNWRASRIEEAQRVARQNGWMSFVADQPMWGPAKINADSMPDPTLVPMTAELYAFHERAKFPSIPYASQSGGLLQKIKEGRQSLSVFESGTYGVPDNTRRYQAMQDIASGHGWTLTQTALAYMQSQPFVTIPIIGSRTPDQLKDSLSAADLRLTPDERKAVDGGGA